MASTVWGLAAGVGGQVKNVFGRSSDAPPQPAQNATAAVQQTQNPNASDPSPSPPAEKPQSGELSDTDSLQEAAFDELFTSPVYKQEMFEQLLNREKPTRGSTDRERRQWNWPRRWKVLIWDLYIKNCMTDDLTAFCELDLGGDREEVRVEVGKRKKVYALGEVKIRLRTNVVYQLKSTDPPTDVGFRACCEYRGSYIDIEQETLKLRLWGYQNWRLNQLEGLYEEPLINFLTGPMYREIALYKPVKGKRSQRCQLSFRMVFQEIFDFELTFSSWRVFKYRTAKEIQLQLDEVKRPKTHSSDNLLKPLQAEPPARSLSAVAALLAAAEVTAPSSEKKPVCAPRLIIKLGTQILVSSTLESTISPRWNSLGRLYFRGTVEELESSRLDVFIEDLSRGRGKRRVTAQGSIPLKGVVDYSYMRIKLKPPSWLGLNYKEELKAALHKGSFNDFGTAEGKVLVSNFPSHRQSGEVTRIDRLRLNLIITIDRVDNVITTDSRKDVSPFVSVTIGCQSKSTRVVKGVTPTWNETLTFPLDLPERGAILADNLEAVPPIWLDVWSNGLAYDDHCGGCSFSLYELVFDPKGNRRKETGLATVTDTETGEVFKATTYKLQEKRPLSFMFATDHVSHVFVSLWTYPDLVEFTGVTRFKKPQLVTVPPVLQEAMPNLTQEFNKKCLEQSAKCENRHYFCYCLDHRQQEQFLPTFLGKVVPPRDIETCASISHYVRCFLFLPPKRFGGRLGFTKAAYQSPETVDMIKASPDRVWATPEMTLAARGGSLDDHVLLQAALLTGLGAHAFVCVGSLWNGAMHMWTATFFFDPVLHSGFVRFWEAGTGLSYRMNQRFRNVGVLKKVHINTYATYAESRKKKRQRMSILDFLNPRRRRANMEDELEEALEAEFTAADEAADEKGRPMAPAPKLPYRTIDFVFNHLNIWVNLQEPDPTKIWYDLWQPDYWYAFMRNMHDIHPCFMQRPLGTTAHELLLSQLRSDLRERLFVDLAAFRSTRNVATRWNRDKELEAYLEKGLSLLYKANTAPEDGMLLARFRYRDWKKALCAHVPMSYRLRLTTFHFNRPEPKYICDQLVSHCRLLESRDLSASFSTAVQLKSLPAGVFSVYVSITMVVKVSAGERRRIHEFKQKKKFAKALKKIQRKQNEEEAEDGTVGEEDDFEEDIEEEDDDDEAQPILDAAPMPQNAKISLVPNANKIASPSPYAAEERTELVKDRSSIRKLSSSSRLSSIRNSTDDNVSSIAASPRKKAEKVVEVLTRDIKLKKKSAKGKIILGQPVPSNWSAPSDFQSYLKELSWSISSCVHAPHSRFKFYQVHYNDGIILFAITPATSTSPDEASTLMLELQEALPSFLAEDTKAQRLLGLKAKIESDDSASTLKPIGEASHEVIGEGPTIDKKDNKKEKKKKKSKHKKGDKEKVHEGVHGGSPEKSPEASAEPSPHSQSDGQADHKEHRKKKKKKDKVLPPNDDGEAQREKFYKDMEKKDPELYHKLLSYYTTQGYAYEHSCYFAAYYTAQKLMKKTVE